jgi:iron uptake system component EfeO
VPTIAAKFIDLTALLEQYRDDTAIGGFVLYTELKPADAKKLTDGLLAVIEPLSDISGKVVNA